MIKRDTYTLFNGKLIMKYRYYDKNGIEIHHDDKIKMKSGKIYEVTVTTDGCLGIDATNPVWIEKERAVKYEYGIYPLTREDVDECEVVN